MAGDMGRLIRVGVAGVVLAIGVAPVVAPSAAMGQMFSGGGGGPGGPRGGGGGQGGEGEDAQSRMFEPSVSTRDLERYAQFLGLTPDQMDAGKSLLDGYQLEADRVAKEARDKVDDVRREFEETRDRTVWQKMGPAMMEMYERRQKMDKALLDDVRLLLTDDQLAMWPQVERMRRREATLGRGLLAGETADVVKLVEATKLPEEKVAELAPVLDRYQEELDRVLAQRNEIYQAGMSKAMALFQAGDFATMQEIWTSARDAGMKVRDVNRRFARQIEGALEGDAQADFAKRFRERSFPAVFTGAYPERAVALVLEFEDLTPEQKEQIGQWQSSYRRQSDSINERWVKAIEEAEMNRSIMEMMRGAWGGGGDDPVMQARASRRELDRKSVEKLKDTLTPEQAARLPDERGRGEEGGRGRWGGGRGGRGGRDAQSPDGPVL